MNLKDRRHLQIPLRFLKDENFLTWLRSTEASIYLCLYTYIVRSNKAQNKIGQLIYNKYYKNGIIAASWDQKTMATKVGLSPNSNGYVSRLLSNMSNNGIIIKHKDKLNRRSINIYEFGLSNTEISTPDTLYVFNYFAKMSANKVMLDFLGGNRPISWGEIGI